MTIEIKATEIKLVPIDSVKPWEQNVNKHSKEQIEALVEQFKFNGMSSPLEVEQGTNEIVAGCGRWMAAKKAGMAKVPVYFRTYESYSHKYARMTADNGLNKQSELDFSKIHLNLENLHLEDIGLLGIEGFKFEPTMIEMVNKGSEADEWAQGMPDFKPGDNYIKLVYIFGSKEELEQYVVDNKVNVKTKLKNSWLVYP